MPLPYKGVSKVMKKEKPHVERHGALVLMGVDYLAYSTALVSRMTLTLI